MKILLTACGYQGGYSLVKEFQKRGHIVVGTDMNNDCAAKFYCDKFYNTPPGSDTIYPLIIEDIINEEKPDVILPGSSYEVLPMALNKRKFEKMGVKMMVSATKVIAIATDKHFTYEILKDIISLPKYIYSETGLVVKPIKGKGAKGIKYLKDNFIMEKLEGEHIDVDVLSLNGEFIKAECKTRERAYGGTLMEGEIVRRMKIINQIKKVLKVLPLDYLSVWQFIDNKLIEINPRIAGAIIDFNLPVMAVELAMGEITIEEIKNYKIPYGKRVARYMHQY